MKKTIIKGNKAITLIALVITIIVLLILAGITVAQLSGNNLFENAKLAKEKYKKSREIEDEIIGDYDDAITGDRGNKFDFSTEEKAIGTWIDGNTLYQKTVSFAVPTANVTVSKTVSELGISNFGGLKNVFGYQEYYGISTNFIPIVYSWTGSDRSSVYFSNNTLNLISNYTGTVYITLQYTKTN